MAKYYSYFIDIYKATLSPVLDLLFVGGCRFSPTCSQYSKEAVNRHGVVKGGYLSAKRILRCNGFTKPGYDPVPKILNK